MDNPTKTKGKNPVEPVLGRVPFLTSLTVATIMPSVLVNDTVSGLLDFTSKPLELFVIVNSTGFGSSDKPAGDCVSTSKYVPGEISKGSSSDTSFRSSPKSPVSVRA